MRLLFPYAATIAAMLLSAQAASAGGLFPKVVVTVAPLKPYVDEILHGHGEAKNLLRPGQDAHRFALTLQQAQMLDDADIVVVPDLAMSPFLQRLLSGRKNLRVVELSALNGAQPLPYARENPWLARAKAAGKKPHDEHDAHDAHDEHEHDAATGNDPHLWLDPERMAALAPPLAAAIAAHAPEARTALAANAQQLAAHLRREVIPALREMLARPAATSSAVARPEIPFLTYHAAYQYFLTRFGLTHYGEITQRPEESMGAKTMAGMLNTATTLHVRCLIGEQKNVLMTSIAKSTGARLVILSPEQTVARNAVDALDWMKNDYDRFLYATAKAFAECL
ncbi:MAG: zinc ABC transporter substrate-binding protein [Alphaproteobacteria bacterium]|nr:zinc ABC transporter substrate-binding protein [Alphaproteobacteria bacterium]